MRVRVKGGSKQGKAYKGVDVDDDNSKDSNP